MKKWKKFNSQLFGVGVMSKICKKFIVYGYVQGVGYRYFAYKSAVKNDIVGYAKNIFDGTVEIVAVGTAEKLEEFRMDLLIGPQRARVDKIVVEECPQNSDFDSFDVF